MPVRILAVVEYDGTDFAGFQLQARHDPPPRTVQSELESALADCTREAPRVIGSGRTDSGVHARGQAVHFDTQARIATDLPRLLQALNAHLPDDVKVRALRRVPDSFHARYSATRRRYCYRVYAGVSPSPLHRRYAHHVRARLDAARMDAGARALVGTHDFVAFAAQEDAGSTVRDVFHARVLDRTAPRVAADGGSGTTSDGASAIASRGTSVSAATTQRGHSWAPPWAIGAPIWHTCESQPAGSAGQSGTPSGGALVESAAQLVEIEVEATGFLRHMMRRIAGTLIRVGDGRLAPEDVAPILASRDKSLAGPTAPARGLCLEGVKYPEL